MQHVRTMLRSQVQCVLATATPKGQPATHLMAYAFSDDLRRVFMASGRHSQKIEDVRANPSVSLLFDNRTGNISDHGDGMLVTASGRAALCEKSQHELDRLHLLQRNPNMDSFLTREDVTVFSVAVDTYAVVVGYGQPELVKP